jgi:hypothetical protein
LFFRKRTSVADFATKLIALHANMFGRGTLLSLASQCHVFPKDEQQFANVLSEWMFFGAYCVRQGVAAKCGENAGLRDAVLDSFLEHMYAGLRKAGVKESELPHLEHCLKARFLEYDRVQLRSQGNPIRDLSSTVSALMFGDTVDALKFSMVSGLHFADSFSCVRGLFDNFKILN